MSDPASSNLWIFCRFVVVSLTLSQSRLFLTSRLRSLAVSLEFILTLSQRLFRFLSLLGLLYSASLTSNFPCSSLSLFLLARVCHVPSFSYLSLAFESLSRLWNFGFSLSIFLLLYIPLLFLILHVLSICTVFPPLLFLLFNFSVLHHISCASVILWYLVFVVIIYYIRVRNVFENLPRNFRFTQHCKARRT